MNHICQYLAFFSQKSDPRLIGNVKFGDYKISRRVRGLVKNLPQNNNSTPAIHNIHNYYLDLQNQLITFLNKKDCYYREHIKATQNCLDAIYMLGNYQFFISKFYDLQDKLQLEKTNNDYLLEVLRLYFAIRMSESKEIDLKIIQCVENVNYTIQYKIGMLSCNLRGLEKLAEMNLITVLKQEQNEGRVINIIRMLKYLYTKSSSRFSCDEDVKEEILSIIKNKYDVLPKLVEKYRDDFIESVRSELKHNIACTIL